MYTLSKQAHRADQILVVVRIVIILCKCIRAYESDTREVGASYSGRSEEPAAAPGRKWNLLLAWIP
jgi:hypothetical protein